jgi:hypothetical protein
VNWPGLVIAASYAALVATAGWWGLAAAAAHIGVLVLCLPRGRKPPTNPE